MVITSAKKISKKSNKKKALFSDKKSETICQLNAEITD